MESEDHRHSPRSPRTPTSADDCTDTTSASHSHGTCSKCGGPTTYSPVLQGFPGISPPPTYRPIRASAINLSPESLQSQQQAILLAPVPQPQKVTLVSPPYDFQVPTKRSHSPNNIKRFHSSELAKNFLGFVAALFESIRGHKISNTCHQSQAVNSIVSILETLIRWVDEIPPTPQSARYARMGIIKEEGMVNGVRSSSSAT
ncbi:hypothetical protein CDL15_Pgr020743 [Punica granatum]|uniref:Serine/threonine-protein phosphatase 2A activator n=1 Tax=Punica granatum TaxID=22663 RepID=A0A218XW11_PUNGR|nr:hypothetical protein CDL15_Pgr020743 [Punica granatum]